MIGRVTALAALAILAACAASGESAVTERAPPPPAYSDRDTAPAPSASVAAPNVVLAQADAPREEARDGDGDITVPGQVQRQVPPPNGDPRTSSERMADIRNWDQCVMQAQNAGESDPLRPSLDVPEDLCRRQLGMANRTAVPNSRLRRQP